jgi:hypothetical protein
MHDRPPARARKRTPQERERLDRKAANRRTYRALLEQGGKVLTLHERGDGVVELPPLSSVAAMTPRDPKLDPVALDLMAWSRLADLKASAAEVTELIAGLNKPLPKLTSVSMLKLYRLFVRNGTAPAGFSLWLNAVSSPIKPP